MKRALFLFLFIISILSAQIQRSGGLQSHVDSLINNMPDAVGNDDYVHPSINDLNTWGTIIDAILATNYADAHTSAQTLGYRLYEFTDTDADPDKVYYVLHMNPAGTNYWGTYIFNPSPDRAQLIIQSPHPIKDFNTGKQGFYVFRESGARVFFLSGTSRCNSSDTTTCDGKTTVCNEIDSLEAYKISDQAHTATGTFQRTTERIDNNFSSSIFIQLHGFAKGGSDPDVIMSNGVQSDLPPTDYLADLRDNLFIQDATLTFKIAHIDSTWDRLLGTTNTQGRFINGSGDPCETSASDNTGRFLHLEQAKPKLREFPSDWPTMANAIAATFAEHALPVELIHFSGKLIENNILLNWETATEVNNYGFEVQRQYQASSIEYQNSTNWEKIGFVQGNGTTNSPKQYSFIDPLDLTLNRINYRLKQIDNDGTFSYSKIVTVDLTDITSVDDEIEYTFTLEQNYPNPFNPTTTISFTVPTVGHAQSLQAKLVVYDILGREVATLVNQKLQPGNYEVQFDGSNLPSGIYFYKLVSGEYLSIKKLMLVK